MRKSKLMGLMLSGLIAAGLFTGCTNTEETPETTAPAGTDAPAATTKAEEPAAPATEELSGSVTVGGSTSVESVILSAIEVFCEKYPDTTITYEPTGSSTGVKSAASGDYDIGLASRDVKSSETEELGAKGTVFAIDGIAIVVNNANSIADLTIDQIKTIAEGSVTNWSELGGEDAPIVLIGREAGSGTRDGFESIVGVEECVYEQELTSTGGVVGAVSQNVNAIGYVSLSSVDAKIKPVTVNGVEATEDTIKDGSYKMQRNFNFVTIDSKELSDVAQAFYDFVLSADADDLIVNAGAVPTAK